MNSTANSDAARLLGVLADGREHPVAGLLRACELDATALDHNVARLGELGYTIRCTHDGALSWDGSYPGLDAARIRARLPVAGDAVVPAVEVLAEATSTNDLLKQRRAEAPTLLCAERQTAGRGRRGRSWVSAPCGIYVSLSWSFTGLRGGPAGLSVLCGVELAHALRAAGMPGVAVKWPNDLVVDDAKLGGILVDLSFSGGSTCHAVMGVGLNWLPPVEQPGDQAVTGLAGWWLYRPHARDQVVALVGAALLNACRRYPDAAAGRLANAWPEVDALSGRPIRVLAQNDAYAGLARGIDADGALRVEVAGQVRTLHAGDVSVRAKR